MYYKEQLINGVWHYKLSPTSEWIPLSVEQLNEKVSSLKNRISVLKAESNYEILSDDLKEVIIAEKENRIKRVESFYPAFSDNKEKCHMVWFSVS